MINNSPSGVMLDASVILELFLVRKKYDEVRNIIKEYEVKYITPITIGILFYFAERGKIDMLSAEALVNGCQILNISESTYTMARHLYKGKDLEDAVQIACAIENNISCVITLNKDMQTKYAALIDMVKC